MSGQARFKSVFAPGHIWTVQGPKGAGKSTWGIQIMQRAAECGYAVASNVMLKRPTRDASGKIVGWEPKHGLNVYENAEMKREGGFIIKVLSFAEMVYRFQEMGVFQRRQRILLVLDESMMVSGLRGGSGGGMQSTEGVEVATFATQIRKLGLCIVILGLGDRFLAGIYRSSQNETVITGTMRRVKLPGYDIREVIEVKTAVGAIYVNTLPLRGLARPESMLEEDPNDDGPVFESFSPASFSQGVHRNTKRPFSLGAFLLALSNVIREYAPQAIEDFLEEGDSKGLASPYTQIPPVTPQSPEEPDTPESASALAPVVPPDRADVLRSLIRQYPNLSDASIGKMVTPRVSKQRVNELRKEMRERGEL